MVITRHPLHLLIRNLYLLPYVIHSTRSKFYSNLQYSKN